MLKRRVSLLCFLCILGQAGVLGELGELLTDQSDRHKEYLLNTWVLFLVTFYISLSILPTTEVACPSGGSIRPWYNTKLTIPYQQ